MALSQAVKDLEVALAVVRRELLQMDVTAPGFTEVRRLYNEISDSLMQTAHKDGSEIALRLHSTSEELANGLRGKESALKAWAVPLGQVIGTVGGVLTMAGYPNPLGLLLGAKSGG